MGDIVALAITGDGVTDRTHYSGWPGICVSGFEATEYLLLRGVLAVVPFSLARVKDDNWSLSFIPSNKLRLDLSDANRPAPTLDRFLSFKIMVDIRETGWSSP